MYKNFIILLAFMACFVVPVFAETVWENPKDIFMDYVRRGDEIITEKQEKLDAQIQLDLQIQNIYLDLPECLDIALQNNINMKIARNTMEASKWEFRSKLAEFLPDLSSTLRIQQLQGTFLVGNVAPDLVHEIPVFFGILAEYNALDNNKIFFEAKIKDLLKKSEISNNEFTKDETILYTTLAYFELLSNKLNIEVLRTNLLDRQEQLRLTQARYEIGVGEKFDVLRADAQLQLAKQELVTELNDLRFSQAKLARIMGLDVLAPVYPKDSKIKTLKLFDEEMNIENIYNTAMRIRPDIRAKELQLKAQRYERNSNWGDFIPKFKLYYQYTQSGVVSTGIRFGDTLSAEMKIPIGKNLGVKTFANYKRDDENLQKAIWEFTKYKRDIKQNIMESVYNTTAALEKIEASKKEVAAAQRAVDTALARMEIGEDTFIDVIEAQATKIQSRQNLIENVIEYNCAQVQLLFDSGLITVGDIIEKYNND